jgi:hypothetical protein
MLSEKTTSIQIDRDDLSWLDARFPDYLFATRAKKLKAAFAVLRAVSNV